MFLLSLLVSHSVQQRGSGSLQTTPFQGVAAPLVSLEGGKNQCVRCEAALHEDVEPQAAEATLLGGAEPSGFLLQKSGWAPPPPFLLLTQHPARLLL